MKTSMNNNLTPQEDEYIITLVRDLEKETDRGLAIIVGAYIEQLLQNAIIKRFGISSRKKQTELFEGPTSLLGTFSSKIIFAHVTGIIDDINKDDIHQIKQIRNEFAHRFNDATFSTEKIVDLCNNLKLARIGETPKTAREKFKKTSIRLMMNILASQHER